MYIHIYTYIYIYIYTDIHTHTYIERERGREREKKGSKPVDNEPASRQFVLGALGDFLDQVQRHGQRPAGGHTPLSNRYNPFSSFSVLV